MTSLRRRALLLPVLLALALAATPAHAEPMHVMDSRPSGAAVMTQGATEFFVRFDGPVDHARSMLTVLRDGRVVQALHPRLNSQPSVLYSGVRRLPPGDYVLHWVAASAREQDVSEGDIAFAVR